MCLIGDIAQLGERSVRNAEVTGSNPAISTFFMPVCLCSAVFVRYLCAFLLDFMRQQAAYHQDALLMNASMRRSFLTFLSLILNIFSRNCQPIAGRLPDRHRMNFLEIYRQNCIK